MSRERYVDEYHAGRDHKNDLSGSFHGLSIPYKARYDKLGIMNFKDLLEDLHTGPDECKVVRTINLLSDSEREFAMEALDAPERYSAPKLRKALEVATGQSVSAGAISNHRKGACPCRSQTH